MRKLQIGVVLGILGVSGLAVANYFIKTESVKSCTSWKSIKLENGQNGYVCTNKPWQGVQVPDAGDTKQAIQDLNWRVQQLEYKLANMAGPIDGPGDI